MWADKSSIVISSSSDDESSLEFSSWVVLV